jgi:regulatory protein
MKEIYTIKDAIKKSNIIKAYQERCHEVESKLRTMKMDSDEIDQIIVI